VIEIDGSYGEGGGQIVRTACSLAVLTHSDVRIFNIRLSRPAPGLRPQHLLGVTALAEFSGGHLGGASVGSTELLLRPGRVSTGDLHLKLATAGSIPLILQTLIPASLNRSESVTVGFDGGATDTPFAPPLDYLSHVFLWFLERMGIGVEIAISRRGYYPKGGARLSARIRPARPTPLSLLDRGKLTTISLISQASESLKMRRVAERQLDGALNVPGLQSLPRECRSDYAPSISPGSSMCIAAHFDNAALGASCLGAPGKRAEEVGREAAQALLAEIESGACLDRHMADQILLYLALAGGQGPVTVAKITTHCKTNMWVIEKFLPGRFQVEGNLIRWTTL
jgi:RNA 3'-terminal phosphate cyclase (GTP)